MSQLSLTEVLRERTRLSDKGICFIEGGEQEDFLSYPALYDAAVGVLAYLQSSGIRPKEELIFQIEDNRTFLVVFWACVLGGIIPVPIAIGRNDDHKQKLFNVWPILNAPWIIISEKHLQVLERFAGTKAPKSVFDQLQARRIGLEEIFSDAGAGEIYPAQAEDIAFIQFSSGSTGSPKGVTLTHRNLITNIEAITRGGAYTDQDSLISWMPLTHDMGLIGFHLNPLYCGIQHYLIPTTLFVRRPAIWLDKVSEHKVSVLCSPNFGYHYVIRHCLEGEAPSWDLAHVRLIYNGAEPISEALCDEFLTEMAPFGLRDTTMCPVYGLAEATLAVSMSDLSEPVRSLHLDRATLSFGDFVTAQPPSAHTVSFVNVGKQVAHCAVRIADRQRQPLPDHVIGQVEIKGPNVTAGYYNNRAATEAAIDEEGWLNTGDLGFMHDGQLFITGRDKDIVFVNGQNYYPHDIERVGEEVEGIELNKLAVAGYFNHEKGKDELLAFAFHRGEIQKFFSLAQLLQKHINQQMGLTLDRIIPVRAIPKTTSGKIQRFKLLEQFQQGAFAEVELQLEELYHKENPITTNYTAPASSAEQKMQAVWEQVLGRTNLSVTDSFFTVGGNSLKAAELGMRLQKEFAVVLPLAMLYEKPSIRSLTEALQELKPATYTPLPRAAASRDYPVSPAQRRLYYQWRLKPSSISYNIPTTIQLDGPIDYDKITAAFREILARHDALRMRFVLREEPQFQIQPTESFELEILDASPTSVTELLSSLVQPFDLAQGPLFRAKLIKLKAAKHLLFLDLHHIISDGLSVYKLLNELWQLYAGKQLATNPPHYQDFVNWEQNQRNHQALQSQESFWRSQLSGELPILSLPWDYPRPALFADYGGKVTGTFPGEQAQTLRRFAAEQGCTLHVLLFACYHLLLTKYSGQEELLIGIPVAGRPHPDLQEMQGMFVNNLPIRYALQAETSFSSMLKSLNALMQEALSNQDYPFAQIANWETQNRDVSRNPLFDTMFVFQNMGLPATQIPGIQASRFFFDPGFSKYDLSLEVFDEGDALEYAFEYASSLFKKESIVRMAAHFETLVDRLIQAPGQPLAEISLLSREAYTHTVLTFNQTDAPLPNKTIPALFEEQVARTPDNIAIGFEGTQLSYQMLKERADRLALQLQRLGLKPGAVVAIKQDRTPSLVISILAVLKAGACYVAIDPDLPEERISFILSDSQATIFISGEASCQRLETSPSASVGESLAYLMYTSGTTGKPKGVMIGQRSLVNYLNWAAKRYASDGPADFPLFTSISFDLTVTALFTPLITGNTLVIYGQQEQALLLDHILTDNQVDMLKLTPAHLKLLCQREAKLFPGRNRVRRLIVGGEQLSTQLARETWEWFGQSVEIINEYGPTEATVGCVVYAFGPTDQEAVVPIGRPIQNTQVYALDQWLQPVPEGVVGELYIAGAGLAAGYLNRAELTAEKFVPNPFSEGSRMYKTGDLVRRLSNETLQYMGRRDEQIKINGYRIELPEIVCQLSQHPQVREALVRTEINKNGNPYLKAYYIPAPDRAKPDESALRQYLARHLPHYMVPARFISIPSVPLTQNGKVAYAALAQWDETGVSSAVPRKVSETEALLIRAWEAVLNEKDLGPMDNFYELGGDSIKAVQIAARLREQGLSVRVEDILTYHTIEQISQRAEVVSGTPAYAQEARNGDIQPWPIISWFFEQALEEPAFFHQSLLLALDEKTDPLLLEEAFAALLKHHDGLRLNRNAATQRLFYNPSHLAHEFKFQRFEAVDGDDTDIFRQVRTGLSLEESLLLQGALITDKDHLLHLYLTAHHLLVDGISWRILLEDLRTLYEAMAEGQAATLAPKTAALVDWQQQLAAYAQKAEIRQEQPYWDAVAATPFSLPLDEETEDWQVANLKTISRSLGEAETQFLLKEAPLSHKTDILLVQIVALCKTLKEWTHSSVCLIELENHGRHLAGIDTSRTVGWFTAMYPVKLVLEEERLDEQIRSIKQQLQQVPHHGLGYGLNRYLGPSSPKEKLPRSEIRFNYLGQFGPELNNEYFSFEQQYGLETAPQHPVSTKLEINTLVIEGCLQVAIHYNRKAFHAATIQWILDRFFHYLDELITHHHHQLAAYLTPTDFEGVDLNQEELDALFN